ncbi:unnamed protein product, partial [Brenthis ino]
MVRHLGEYPNEVMPIPATAANLNEISQLRRRYYSAQVYAQTQVHSLFLSLSYSGGTTTRHDRVEMSTTTFWFGDVALQHPLGALGGSDSFGLQNLNEEKATNDSPI